MAQRRKGSGVPVKTKGTESMVNSVKPKKLSNDELVFQKQIKVLEADAGSMRGRDGVVIVEDLKLLQRDIEASTTVSKDGKIILLAELKTVLDDTEAEDVLEKSLGKVLQWGMLATTFIPMVLTLFGSVREFATRPSLSGSVVHGSRASPFVAGRRAVVTGGCGSLGLDLATLLAEAGGQVVLGCWGDPESLRMLDEYTGQSALGRGREDEEAEFDDLAFGESVGATGAGAEEGGGESTQQRRSRNNRFRAAEDHFAKLGLLRGSLAGPSPPSTAHAGASAGPGWVEVWPLDLESFDSVRNFAARFYDTFGRESGGVEGFADTASEASLDVLVHAAATKRGCGFTQDGHDRAVQVNYLSPFVLNSLFLPALEHASSSSSSSSSASTAVGDSLLPTEAVGAGARVVHVSCGSALQLADWLPWPLRRTNPTDLPHLDLGELLPFLVGEQGGQQPGPEPGPEQGEQKQTPKRCTPLAKYASSKLAAVSHARELGRRLKARGEARARRFKFEFEDDDDDEEEGGEGSGGRSGGALVVASHVVNPGALDNAFGRSAEVVSPKPSARQTAMAYFPPAWLAKKVFAYTVQPLLSKLDLQGLFLRPVRQGALAVLHVATHPSLLAAPADAAAPSSSSSTKKKKAGERSPSSGVYSDTVGDFVGCGRGQAWECGRMAPSELPALALNRTVAQGLWQRTERILQPWLAPVNKPLSSSSSSSPIEQHGTAAVPKMKRREEAPLGEASQDVAKDAAQETQTLPTEPKKREQSPPQRQHRNQEAWDEASAEFDDIE